jgi:hypothetical protein
MHNQPLNHMVQVVEAGRSSCLGKGTEGSEDNHNSCVAGTEGKVVVSVVAATSREKSAARARPCC